MTPHYPETFRDKSRWTERGLVAWLKNPRTVRPWTGMQPVHLTEPEFRELMDILKVEGIEGSCFTFHNRFGMVFE